MLREDFVSHSARELSGQPPVPATKRAQRVLVSLLVAGGVIAGLLAASGCKQQVGKPNASAATAAEKDYELGLEYYRGGGNVSIDPKQSLASFERAAKAELPEAEAEVARFYGEGNLFDFGEAASTVTGEEMAARAWRHGLAERAERRHQAEYEVANLYLSGLGTTRDNAKARQGFERAAARGNIDAKRALGFIYLAGAGVPVDMARAETYLREAAKAGNASAQILLGLVYQEGATGAADHAKAMDLYRAAAAQGSPSALEQLAMAYEEGKYLQKDLAKAVELRRKAAAKGLLRATYQLGVMYENGSGVTKDLNEAERLYQKLVDHSYPGAKKALDRVRTRNISPVRP